MNFICNKISDHMETSQPGFTTHIIAMQVDQPIKQNRVLFWACTNLGTLQGKKTIMKAVNMSKFMSTNHLINHTETE